MSWLVDGMNVIGSRPDGWWRDRDGAKRGLVAALGALGEPAAVVFDGAPVALDAPGGVEIAFAPGGPDAADAVIAGRVEAAPDPSALRVVTSDRALAARVRAAGADVVGAGAFRARLGEGR